MLRVILLLTLCLLAACQRGGVETPAPPIETPEASLESPVAATLPAVDESTAPEIPGSTQPDNPVLGACPADEQERAFVDGTVPSLAALEPTLCYDLELSLDEEGGSFEALARVTILNGSEHSWPDLMFRLYPEADEIFGGELGLHYATVSGIAVEWEQTLEDHTALHVPLSTPLPPGGVVRVDIAWSGIPAEMSSASPEVYGIFGRGEQSVTLVSWFPLLALWDASEARWDATPVVGEGDAVVAESALIRASLSGPSRFRLASSGVVIEESKEGEIATYRVVSGPARDLALVWTEGYEVEEERIDGTLIRNWYLPGSRAGAERAGEAARDALRLFNEWFGPYPFAELDIVAVPLQGAGGVEYPQLYLLAQDLYDNPNSHAFLAFASAHEMAHQWWYSTIGSDVNRDPWQDEALTNWSAILWVEQSQGDESAASYLESYANSVQAFEREEGEEPVSQPLSAFDGRAIVYSTIVYLKGTLFFQAIREEIGDEAFRQALQSYYRQYQFKIAPPEALLDSFERAAGEELDPHFETWGVAP